MTILVVAIYTAVLLLTIFVLFLIIDYYFSIGLFEYIYLVTTGEFSHFVEKRKLVCGDLVFIKFRGKYRKAYIKRTHHYQNTVQLEFDDYKLNTQLVEHNDYHISRIIIPDYMGKAAKLLYSKMESKNEN